MRFCCAGRWYNAWNQKKSSCKGRVVVHVLKVTFFCFELIFTYFYVCRGEAIRLLHVRYEIFPTLPLGKTQPHSHGYGFTLLYFTSAQMPKLKFTGLLSVELSLGKTTF